MSILIDPTLYAPTAAKTNNPCFHKPLRITLSLRAKSPGIVLAAQGATVISSPVYD